jgi:hypothetical protein
MGLKEIECEDVDWIHVAWNRVHGGWGTYAHSNEPSGSINTKSLVDQLSFSKRTLSRLISSSCIHVVHMKRIFPGNYKHMT